ncbi:hypothetical protein Btru_046851 [Bulinus truncatus]|nr:hypothetical protein Btru_046851 [Bulinus truncatus]
MGLRLKATPVTCAEPMKMETSIWVYTSENHGTSIEVPLTPETSVSDVLDCVRDPVRGEGYLVAVAGDTEYILQEGDNAFNFLYQIWNSSGSPLTFLLRYYSQQAEWPPPELEGESKKSSKPCFRPLGPFGYLE